MRHSRFKRCLAFASLAVAILFAALWIRSYWYDTYLRYEARVTQAHINRQFWTFTDSGAFIIGIQWDIVDNPSYKRDRGIGSFYDYPKEPPSQAPGFVVLGTPKSSVFHFLGFQHWVVESPAYHLNNLTFSPFRYNYTWIPFWFPVLLFALPTFWYFIRVRRAGRAKTPNKSLQATRDGALSSAARFTSFGPARLSSGR